jgi:hypothetical protein
LRTEKLSQLNYINLKKSNIMKKLLLSSLLIIAATIVFADVTLTTNTFTQAVVTVNAKTEISFSGITSGNTYCIAPTFTITIWQDATLAAPIISITGTGSGLSFASPTTTASPGDVPGSHGLFCPDVYIKYVYTWTSAQLVAGTYYVNVDRTQDMCGLTSNSEILHFTIAEPQIPVITLTPDELCEDNPVTLSAVFTGEDEDITPAVTVYFDVESSCGTDPGLPSSFVIPAGTVETPGYLQITAGAPGVFTFTITSITYLMDGCGLVTVTPEPEPEPNPEP